MITQATRFLRAAEHALELRLRPGAEAPLRRAADEACRARLADLAETDATAVLRFPGTGVRLGELPLAEFERWPWGARFAARGIARLELSAGPSIGAVAAFLDAALPRRTPAGRAQSMTVTCPGLAVAGDGTAGATDRPALLLGRAVGLGEVSTVHLADALARKPASNDELLALDVLDLAPRARASA